MRKFVLCVQVEWVILSEYDSAKNNRIWYNLIRKIDGRDLNVSFIKQ